MRETALVRRGRDTATGNWSTSGRDYQLSLGLPRQLAYHCDIVETFSRINDRECQLAL